jgi:hypothetical protein
MKEQDVASLASLLKIEPEKVSAAIENGGISDFVNEFTSGHEVFTKSELDGLKNNLKSEFEGEVLNGKIPKAIYDRAKGFALEATEKKIAEQFGVGDYDGGMEGLVNKIVESKAKNPEDVTKLKSRIDELVSEHEREVSELRSSNDRRFVNLRINEIVNKIPIDAEGVKLDNQRKMLRALIAAEFDFGVNDDSVVVNKAPVNFKQKNLDPIPVGDVIMEFAKDYVNLRSDGGGRGDTSSTRSSSMKTVNIKEYMAEKGIQPNSVELFQAIKQFEKDGVEIIE